MDRIKGFLPFLGILLTLALLAPTSLSAQAAPPAEGRQRFIVVLRDGAGSPNALAEEMSRAHGGRAGLVFNTLLSGFAIELPSQAVEALRHDPRIAHVEPDFKVQTTGEIPAGIDRIEADRNLTAAINGADTRVDADIAILDTGIAAHSDLNIAGGVNCTSGSCVVGSFGDVNGHGTHVAGTAAALDNGVGVVGVAPGARLWGIKVLDDKGSGYLSWVIAGLDWVAQQGNTEVVNLSLSCECSSTALRDAITRGTNAGMVIVAAAGNSGKDASTFSPANHPNAITVSAMADFDGVAGRLASATCSTGGTDDSFASFSNYGNVVDVAAPGVCITSTVPGGYGKMSGTSMASPHVAGAAALYIIEKGVAKSSTRWSTVRNGMLSEWSVTQTHACGFSGGKSAERMLMLASCGSGSTSSPTTGTVSGKVTNANTGAAIGGASISVSGTTLSTSTASDGTYTLSSVPTGSQSIGISANGYDNQNFTITVEGGKTATSNVSLMPKTTKALTVAVSPSKTSYRLRETAYIYVTVTSDGAAISSASVQMTIKGANGRTYTQTRSTSSTGRVTFSFKTSSTYGKGTYTVTANASKTGFTTGSGSSSFSVR